jgi:lipopolysaccharide/colanic/teichoic acid biosynthesis glycosyltransferase
MYQGPASTIHQPFAAGYGALDLLPISYAAPPHPRINGWRAAVKRCIDIVVAVIGLVAFGVPMLMMAAIISLESPGSPLFRQRRIGFANVPFEMWKLRTMRAHSDAGKRLVQATRDDTRVTWFGTWLRRSSVDELPQLVNVLRGDMSLVGPRPHAPGTCAGGKPFEMVAPHYVARHRVRPGITGLAQVRGWRGETDTEDKLLRRVEADLEYIDNWSIGLDLAILGRTLASLLSMRNAY